MAQLAVVKNLISPSRGFSTCGCLCDKIKKTRKIFDPRFPISAKHVNEKKKGGTKEMAEKLALHVVQPTGYIDKRNYKFINKKEMIPEFIVPDLTDFKLKPYVPYNIPIPDQAETTAETLFESLYADAVAADFKEGKITPDMDLKDIEKLESLKKS